MRKYKLDPTLSIQIMFSAKGACGVVFTATDAKGNKLAAKRIDGKDKKERWRKLLKI